MPRKSSILSVSFPAELTSDLDAMASQERRSRSELVREAVRQYILLSRWKVIRSKASRKAMEQRLREEDMEKLVDKDRGARRRRP
jgi:CopG family transcriptional regulator/antitoxin EndoAI